MDTDQAERDADHLRLLSAFHYVVGGLTALAGCFPIIHLTVGIMAVRGHLGPPGKQPPAFFGWFFIVLASVIMLFFWTLAVLEIQAARNLARRQRRMFCMIVAAIMAATCMPLGTILGVFTIVVLERPSVRDLFAGTKLMGSGGAR